VGVRSPAFMKRLFPHYQNLLKAHLDELMTTGLLGRWALPGYSYLRGSRHPWKRFALFAPDAFLAIATITALSLGWAIARAFFTLHPRRVMNDATTQARRSQSRRRAWRRPAS
jgi:hypothetical protein